MKSVSDIRPGNIIKMDNSLYYVEKYDHRRSGRGGATIKMKFRNIATGLNAEKVFSVNDRLEDIALERAKFEFLYEAGSIYYFMNQDTYEQIELEEKIIGDSKYYLIEGSLIDVQQYGGNFVGLDLPLYVTLNIVETEPGVRGNTADGKVVKDAVTNTGLTIKVPGFIEQGDDIVINTQTGEYMERAKK